MWSVTCSGLMAVRWLCDRMREVRFHTARPPAAQNEALLSLIMVIVRPWRPAAEVQKSRSRTWIVEELTDSSLSPDQHLHTQDEQGTM